MTYTTFKISNNKSNNFNNICSNCPFHKPANYSALLDNIITTNIIQTNPYLKSYATNNDSKLIDAILKDAKIKTITHAALKGDDAFAKAATFLSNYKILKKNNKFPFEFGKLYKLANGKCIIFYDNEIQIDSDIYSYDDFNDYSFLSTLSNNTKKIIINIFGDANIKININ